MHPSVPSRWTTWLPPRPAISSMLAFLIVLLANGFDGSVRAQDAESTAVMLSLSRTEASESVSDSSLTVAVKGTLNRAARDRATVVTVSVAGGTAGTADFTAVDDFSLSIPANALSGTADFTLELTNDDEHEADETLIVSGTTSGLTVEPASFTIVDDDEPPITVAIRPPHAFEEDSGSVTLFFDATSTGLRRPNRTLALEVSSVDGTAASPEDFRALPLRRLRYSPNHWTDSGDGMQWRATRTATLIVVDDTLPEGTEDLTVRTLVGELPGGPHVTGPPDQTIAIIDDEPVAGAPTVHALAITSDAGPDATYAAGETIEATVMFDQTVTVTGTPQLALNVGGWDRTADYRSGAGAALLFVYTVAAGESDTVGVGIEADSLSLNGGTIRDGSDNDAVLSHAGIATGSWHKVDAVKPILAVPDGATVDGDRLLLTYQERLDRSSTPPAESLLVTVEGETRDISAVAVAGRTVNVRLDTSVEAGEAVSVSYSVTTDGGANAIRDVAGNDASEFTARAVTNRTGDRAQQTVGVLPLGMARRIGALLDEKARRTPAQRKVSSQLLDAGSRPAARASAEAPGETTDPVVPQDVVTVDIRADVTAEVLEHIRSLGGRVVNSFPNSRSIRAQLPRAAVVPLAELDAVQMIRPAEEPVRDGQLPKRSQAATAGAPDILTGSKGDTSEGDVAHRANVARQTYGVDGTGIGIGVLSDAVATLASQQATGDVPSRVAILPGQAGGAFGPVCGRTYEGAGNEGTALLEIAHDLAPGANLFFATGTGGRAQMAQNILDLCTAGADVIVDDISYLLAPPFQDGVIARAVSTVTANGCRYFSAAGNGGNMSNATASVWEGDFAAGPALNLRRVGSNAAYHDFGGGVVGNAITKDSLRPIVLQWSDPVGASANDYDLFLIDANNNVLASSTNTQDGTQDPIEAIASPCSGERVGARLVIVKNAGAADRYLRLSYAREGLAVTTGGHTFGHGASQDAIGVAAVDVAEAAGAGGVFNGTEPVEKFSSDGPRRIFFEADGTPITPMDFSSTGGRVLQKPDLAAADGVVTSAPGFATFYGTSAAAPHAAAIAALVLEATGGPANVTQDELRTALTGSALDIEATGVDHVSGAGIVMAPDAVDAVDVAVADRNGAPTVASAPADRTLAPGGGVVAIGLSGVFSDPDNDALTYTVWSSDAGRLSVGALAGTVFTLTPLAPGRLEVTVVATDPEGLSVVLTILVTVEVGNRDYDADDDGLIDVGTLAQLNAMRFDLDADGVVDEPADWSRYHAGFVEGAAGMGCPDGCIGYELTADLDFDTDADGDIDSGDDYWNAGDGWTPVGNAFNPFTAALDGNGHTVSNLFIDFPDSSNFYPAGLFGMVQDGVVRGVGLLDVDVTGGSYVGALVGYIGDGEIGDSSVTGSLSGDDYVGGLVGRMGVFWYTDESHSAVTASDSTAEVSGRESVGGLVGLSTSTGGITASFATGRVEGTERVGGLVGFSVGPVTASYATGHVEGTERVGGLAGDNRDNITASYATGHVEGGDNVGGLAGFGGGTITASYSTGLVWGNENVGGLVGNAHPVSTQAASYWDMHTSGHAIGTGGRTTTELQAPTDYGGIYQTWNLDLDGDTEADDPWDFGTSSQYPVVAADVDGNGEATWQEFGYQLRAGPVLTASTSEGQGVVLTWTAADTSPWSPAPAVTYALIRDDAATVEFLAPDLAGLQYTDSAVTAGATYTYQVAALVDGGAAARSALVTVVAGVANQPPRFRVGGLPDRTLQVGTTEVVDVAGAFSDLDDTLTYAASSSDAAVATVSVSGSQVTITPVAAGRATITVTATESGSTNLSVTRSFQVTVGTETGVDYDADNDGLIDIWTLAQLDAVRHDFDGDGVPVASGTAVYAAAFPAAATGMGCPSGGGCTGYELETDLDFDTNGDGRVDAGDEYWDNGRGWEPIGQGGYPLYATFEGNGRTIRNLFSRYFSAGLFGGNGGVIRRVGLIDVDVSGGAWVGGLVAENRGEIHSSYVTGRVSGDRWVGGLVGTAYERGRITASFSTARVTGSDRLVGGLVGVNSGAVSASYATGRVSGGDGVGGLIGGHCGSLTAGYATGTVSGGSDVGGLIGLTDACSDDDTVVTASYWDTVTSGLSSSAAGNGGTTSALQEPTGATGLYASWNGASWDFGTSSQYPALQVNFDPQGSATWQEFGYQLRAGPTLSATSTETTAGEARVNLTWTGVETSHWTPAPDVTYTVSRADGSTVETLAEDLGELRYTDAAARAGATYTYRVAAVVDGGEAVRGELLVNTPGNSPAVAVGTLPDRWLHVGDAAGVELGKAFEDPENDALTYAVASSATDVATVSVSGTRVTITPVAAGTATITVTAMDTSGSTDSATQTFAVTVMPSSAIDYDTDDDGLIEIRSLKQLDAVRWDLDGDGLRYSLGRVFYPLAYPTVDDRQGCGGLTGCVGYELGADLDFDTNGNGRPDKDDAYWGNGRGWIGIGGYADPFEAIFEGNGRTISNLFIDSSFTQGLFGVTGPSSVIRHVGLTGVAVSGTDNVGGLVGLNGGSVTGSYVTGTVSGTGAGVGGLVGENRGSVVASYATVEVTGGDDAGGLVGSNGSTVTASYAAGRVTGGENVGGLVGSNSDTITASYATGPVSASDATAGGLVGSNSGTITAGYWDTTTSSLTTGAGQGRNTGALQTPSGYSGIYSQWNVDLDGDGANEDFWDFGTSGQYPALKVNFDRQGVATWQEFGHQLRAGPTLTAAPAAGQAVLTWTAADTSHWSPAPAVTYTIYRDDGTTVEAIEENLAALSHTDTSVTAGATYTYQVAAVVEHGEATRSAPVTAETGQGTAVPAVSIAAGASPVTEGTAVAFTLTRTGAATAALTVAVSVTEVGAMLAPNAPASVTFGADESSATLTVATDDDAVVEGASAVTAAIASGEGYAAAAGAGSASVSVEDNDAATFTVTAGQTAIAEGGSTAVTVAVANGVTFAADQTITLSASGTAAAADYTLAPMSLTLDAGATAVSATLTAVDDEDAEEAETVVVSATHNGSTVGPATVTIEASDAAVPEISIAAGTSPVTEGTAAAFTLTRTGATAAALTVSVSVTEGGAMLAANAPASVTFNVGESSATLTVATVDDAVVEGASAVTAAVASGEGYAAAAEAGSAQVSVEDNDAPSWTVSPDAVEIAEGATATLTVSAGAVTFAEAQHLAIRIAGTATADDYTLSPAAPQVAAGAGSVSVSVTATDDVREEDAETVRVTVLHGGTEIGTATVTIAASDAGTDDATLSGLTLSGIGIGTFDPATTAYTATVGSGVSSTTVTATPSDPDASVTITDTDGSTAGTSRTTSLSMGPNVITITVVSEDEQTTRIYTVTVTRLTADRAVALRRPELELDDLDDNVPFGLWSDGTTLWSSMWWSVGLVAFDLATHGRVSGRDLATASDNASPTGLWSDGTTLWVADYGGGVYGYRLSDGARAPGEDLAATLEAAGNARPTGLWSDGTTLWVADHFDAHVYAYRLSDKARDEDREFALEDGTKAYGLWSDGTTVWTSDFGGGRVVAYRLSDGVRAAEKDYDTSKVGNEAPLGLWSDGETLWVGDRFDGKLYAYALEAEEAASADATLSSLTLLGVDIGAFDAATTGYTASVGPAVSSTTVTATPTDADATVTITDRGGSTTDGPREVSLAAGANTITATVTAADGQTTATYTVTVTRATATPAFTVTAGQTTIAEGGSTAVTVAIANGVTFAADQTVTLTASGTAAAADYTLDPTTLTLNAGATAVSATLTAVDDEAEEQDETVTVSAAHNGATVGTATVTIAASDAAVPEISIAAGTSPITEGTAAAFTLTRTGATAEALTVSVSVTEVGAMLAANPPASVTFGADESSAVLTVATDDDAVVEGASAVTAAVASGAGYAAAAGAGSAQVSVEDNDAATFTVTAGQTAIEEGGSTAVTVAIASGVTFAADQTVTLTASGTATAADYTLAPTTLTLDAGETAVSATLTAVDDDGEEQDETVTVSAAHNGSTVGTATVTIAASDAGVPEISIAAGTSPVTEGTAAAFTLNRTGATAEALTVSVSVTEGGAMLAADPPASVTFGVGESSATLTVATDDDAVVEGASAVTAAVASGAGYTVGTTASASVTVEDDDAATFTVTAAPEAIAEGESATLTVAIANGVTFAEDQALALHHSGTASPADYTGVPGALTLGAGDSSVTAELAATDDQEEEEPETVTVAVSHGGVAIGSATVTIRSVSHDATLRALSLSGIDIGTFSPGTTDYAATVAPAMSSTTVTATASHEEAEVSIVPGAGVSLATGANEIAVTVTAEDGTTTNIYTVTVMRAEELPDPIPESISKGEIVVAAVPFVRAPETADVATSSGATDAHARIQYLKPVPGRDRLAFNDIRGILYLTDAEGRTPAVYLDLREQEVGFYANRNPNESGFLGFAFHPEFSSEGKPGYGKFYTAFSANVSSGVADYLDLRRGHESVIREWTATDPAQDVFAGTSREVFRIGQFASNHNIGTLAFNAAATAGSTDEGALYFGLGDGGSRNDPEEYGQDLSTPLGAILRINPLSTSAGTSYGIPSDNPFVAEADAASEIWAYGLRHPQHFSFDSSGRMFINDIGQDQIEEVNLGRAGGNYGWRLREGTFATASGLGIPTSGIRSRVYALPSDDSGFEYPIAQYDHNEGFAISSGFVYEGQAIPALRGRYVFSELVLGRIFAMDATNPTPGTPARIEEVRITFDGQERDLADVAAIPTHTALGTHEVAWICASALIRTENSTC